MRLLFNIEIFLCHALRHLLWTWIAIVSEPSKPMNALDSRIPFFMKNVLLAVEWLGLDEEFVAPTSGFWTKSKPTYLDQLARTHIKIRLNLANLNLDLDPI
eukprot:TRINITY_DN21686_c0_g1_i1.p1 TRINITY_DN21686_c0_g1~~TRINITY_DN21686_c0_g1_i1.p1  ORF type:complete len:101 (-),score=11.13 TRINITY_DN21686_c0_g1_i1:16-318(-)